MKIHSLGDSALIVRVVDDFEKYPDRALNTVLAALRYLESAKIPGVLEMAPAYTTIGVFYDPMGVERDGPRQSPFEALDTKIRNVLSASSFENETEIEM